MLQMIRRDPFTPRMVRDLFGTFDPFFGTTASSAARNGSGNLALDISEKDGAVLVRASLPGFKKDEIDIQVHDGMLEITAEWNEESDTSDEAYYRRERRYGSLTRTVALPEGISDADATAELVDGVLTLRLSKAESAKPKQVLIT